MKHGEDLVRYLGEEVLGLLVAKAGEVFERGMPEEPRRGEIQRRKTIVKYKCKTIRVVVAKTQNCYVIITAHPYPGKVPDYVL